MLLQLDNTNPDNINKLLAYARRHQLQLSVVDENAVDYFLSGKPLTTDQLTRLIDNSRKSGIITMADAHQIARNSFNAD